jgi:endoglucanase
MDEVGLIITYVDDNNFGRVGKIGRIALDAVANSPVQIIASDNTFQGIVRSEASDTKATAETLFVDPIGNILSVGDVVSFHGSYAESPSHICAKTSESRIGAAILLNHIITSETPEKTVYYIFTAQSELGHRGAKVAMFDIQQIDLKRSNASEALGTQTYGQTVSAQASIAVERIIAVDTAVAYDYPSDKSGNIISGGGVSIRVKDGSILTHASVKNDLINTATAHQIPYQLEVKAKGRSDAGIMQHIGHGTPTGVISVPIRYPHTAAAVIAKEDVVSVAELLKLI